ncbi:MAG TPA: LuxR C-terminal-related transcriptional regulator [Nocardioides sp.]|nr:LuxR C-terminal-related transcriptional regulator [Nocardioides sp.]
MLAATSQAELLGASRTLVRRGRITAALRLLDGDPPADGVAADVLRLHCRLARGDLSEAMGVGARIEPHVNGPHAALAHWALGELHSARGQDEAALAHYLAVQDDTLPWRAGAAMLLIRLSRQREAEALALEHLAAVRAQGSSYRVAAALRTLAAVEAGPDRLAHLALARDLVDTDRAPRLAAQIDTDRAGLLALLPDPARRSEAVVLLRGAIGYADREDLWPLHNRIRKLLTLLGQPAPEITSEALARLSPAELRTAQLAASGLTNREIAEQVGVTTRSVEWHLSHVYRKLGIRRRHELAARFATV